MKKFVFIISFVLGCAAARATAPNDIDTVWMRWMYDISDVCWSPNDSVIAAFSYDRQYIKFINPQNGNVDTTISCPYTYADSRYSKDGKYLLANRGWDYAATPYIIDTKTYKRLDIFENPGTRSMGYSMAPNNNIVGISDDNTLIRVWDMTNGRIIKSKTHGTPYDTNNQRSAIVEVDYTGDGKYILMCVNEFWKDEKNNTHTIDKHLYLLDTANLEIIKDYKDKYGYHLGVVPSKTGKYFLSFVDEEYLPHTAFRVTDVESGEVIFDAWGYKTTVPDVDFSSDDRFVAFPVNMETGTERIEFWDILNKTMVSSIHSNPVAFFSGASFSTDDKFILAYSAPGLYLYETSSFLSSEISEIPATITFPNPAHNSIVLEFTLEKAASTQVELLDMQGNSLRTVANEMMEAGLHSFAIDLAGLANGTYFIRIASAGNTSTTKFIINN